MEEDESLAGEEKTKVAEARGTATHSSTVAIGTEEGRTSEQKVEI